MGNTTQQNDRSQTPQKQQDQTQERTGASPGGSGQNQAGKQPGGSDAERTHRKDQSA